MRWFGTRRSARSDRDIDREIHAHLELEAEERRDAGMTPQAARQAARRAFGNRTLVGEDVRATWGTSLLDAFLQDVRYALRTIRRAPGFAAIAVASSAIGIGACSVIFAVLAFALFQRMPVDDPGRLVNISEYDKDNGEAGDQLSYPNYRDVQQRTRAFEGVAAYDPMLLASVAGTEVPASYEGMPESKVPASFGRMPESDVPASFGAMPASGAARGDAQRHWGALVTANYFAVVKPRFVVGRGFDPRRDDTPGAPRVVVLSHRLWRAQFQGDRGIVGRSVTINGRPATVVGVTAEGFVGTEVPLASAFFIPFSMLDELEARLGKLTENRQRYWLMTIGRLRPGVDVRAARAELDLIARDLAASGIRALDRGFHAERAGQINPELRGVLLLLCTLLLGATSLVLLTACANVANLLLGRASARKREIAARMALGASRGRLVRQLLTESLVLALLGGLGGWVLATAGTSLIGLIRVPVAMPLDLSIPLDYRVLFFSTALSILTGIAFGLVPALRATRADLVADLKVDERGSTGGDRFGLRSLLVVTQVAICTLLLVCMGLFQRSLSAARALDVGLRNRNLLMLSFDPSLDQRSDPQARVLLGRILDRAEALPGVRMASLTTAVPLTLVIDNGSFQPEEKASDPNSPPIRTDIYSVGPRFFETMGIPLLEGREAGFDGASAERMATVNDAFARAAFPGQSAVGQWIVGDGKRLRIAGVVATTKSRTIGEAPRACLYLPILSEYTGGQTRAGVTLLMRSQGGPTISAAAVRDAIRDVDPSLPVFSVQTIEGHLQDALLVPRLAGMLSAIAGGVGLVLATIGVYGVISFAVARRRREIGIRLAIGARRSEILRMILKRGLTLGLAGIVLGCVAALGVTRFTASLLYGVSPTDALTFAAVPLFLLAVALLACLVPAASASRLDPVEVLRSE